MALLGGAGRCPPEAIDAALVGLAARALLWRGEGGAIHPAPAVQATLSYPLGLGRPLAVLAARSQVTVADLEGAVVRLGLPKKQPGERKSDLIARLGVALADPVLINGVVAAAPPAARELAHRLAGGRPTVPVQRAYGRSAGSPYEWLAERLLVAPFDFYQAEMPREVGLALRGGEAGLVDLAATRPAVATSTPHPAMVSAAGLASAAEAVRVTEAILEAWSAAPPAALKAGGIGVRDLKRAALSSGSPEGDVGVYVEVAAAAGLVRQAGDRFLPTSDYDVWRRGEPAQRWLRLASGWLAAGRLPSLAGERDDDDKPIAALNPKFAVRASVGVRAAVLGALADDPTSAPEPKSLAAALLWDGPARWNSFPLNPPIAVDMILREAALLGVVGDGALSPWGLELTAGRYGARPRRGRGARPQRDRRHAPGRPHRGGCRSGQRRSWGGARPPGRRRVAGRRHRVALLRPVDRPRLRRWSDGRRHPRVPRRPRRQGRPADPRVPGGRRGPPSRHHPGGQRGLLCPGRRSRARGRAVRGQETPPLRAAERRSHRGRGHRRRRGPRGRAPGRRLPRRGRGRQRRHRGPRSGPPPGRLHRAARRRRVRPRRAGAARRGSGHERHAVARRRWLLGGDGPVRPAGRPGGRRPGTGQGSAGRREGPVRSGPARPPHRAHHRRHHPRIGGSRVRRPRPSFPAEVSPFDDPDDDLDPFADLVDFEDDLDDDLGFDPGCDCPECVAAATRAVLGDDAVLLAQLSAMLEASPDDTDERIALLDGARRDGRPLLIAYEHPRTGPATDVFRILTVTGTSAHLRDSSGRERLVDVEWIEAIVETGGGPSGRRGKGRTRK